MPEDQSVPAVGDLVAQRTALEAVARLNCATGDGGQQDARLTSRVRQLQAADVLLPGEAGLQALHEGDV